jgi:RimJ/RimL family protein N-acetyltransferase
VTPPYRIESARLVLRPPDATRAVDVKRTEDATREDLRQFMPWADRDPETLEEVIAKLRLFRTRFDTDVDWMYLVFDRTTDEVLGGTGLHPRVGKGGLEIGYWIHAAHMRKGLATEVAAALTKVAFEACDARWVEIRTARTNVRSQGVPKKLGFVHEATLGARYEITGGQFDDAFVFTMFAKDYLESPAQKAPLSAFDAAGRKIL